MISILQKCPNFDKFKKNHAIRSYQNLQIFERKNA